jgi:hypothetical protein
MRLSPNVELGAETWRQALWKWIAVFLFMLPVSWKVGGVPVAVNYTFFALLLLVPRFDRSAPWVLMACAYYCMSFLWGAVFASVDVEGFHLRQFLSFAVFIGAILVSTVPMPFDFELLARATVAVSVCYSLLLVSFLLVHGTHIIANAGMSKSWPTAWVPDWPQRYVIVVLLGVFLSLHLSNRSKWWLLATSICGFCIVATHSMAAYLASFVGMGALAVIYSIRRSWRGLINILMVSCLTFLLVVLATRPPGWSQSALQGAMGEFFSDSGTRLAGLPSLARLFHLASEPAPDLSVADIYVQGEGASAKIRGYIWGRLMTRMIDDRMWLGSGFAGPHLYDQEIGSAHSQYVDVLFRTGPVGLILYLGLCVLLLRRAYRHSPELAGGLLGWMIFGVFHETTKYPYGAFLFFALLSLAWFGWERTSSSPQGNGRS